MIPKLNHHQAVEKYMLIRSAFSITGGSISGPALNGTVKSGLAIDQTLSNGTRENIQWFGTVGNTYIIAQGQGLVGPLFRELQSLVSPLAVH